MASETKYELLYRSQNEVCGDPFPEFVAFAASYPNSSASVLDLGCGQGRDALVFAHRGMSVTGVDISPTGIEQMVAIADANTLPITGVVSDIRDYDPATQFDIIILDRSLHMLTDPKHRTDVLERCTGWLAGSGHILIADQPSNIPAFADWFASDSGNWHSVPNLKRGFWFVQKT